MARGMKNKIFYLALAAFVAFGFRAEANGTMCVFSPHLVCAGELVVRCPLCPMPGYPRPSLDGKKLVETKTKTALEESKSTKLGEQKDLLLEIQKVYGPAGPQPSFRSDQVISGIGFPKIQPEEWPNPEVTPDPNDLPATAEQILQSQYAQEQDAVIATQMAYRGKKQGFDQKTNSFQIAVAMNAQGALQDAGDGTSPLADLNKAIAEQAQEAASKNTLRSYSAANGAVIRSMLALQTRQLGLISTELMARTQQAMSEMPLIRPENANPGAQNQGYSEENRRGRPEVHALANLPSSLAAADLGAESAPGLNAPIGNLPGSIGIGGGYSNSGGSWKPGPSIPGLATPGFNLPRSFGGSQSYAWGGGQWTPVANSPLTQGTGYDIPENLRLHGGYSGGGGAVNPVPGTPGFNEAHDLNRRITEIQWLNFNREGQKQKDENFYNSAAARSYFIEKLHNDRVHVFMAQENLKYLDNTISCHQFSQNQLERVRQAILPKLWLDEPPRTIFTRSPTRVGPYPEPDYPNQTANLEAAFEAIAGRPAFYTQRPDGTFERSPPVIGEMLRLDPTTYLDAVTRHRSATQAACTVTSLMMRGVTADPLMYPTPCRPVYVRSQSGDGDWKWCVVDSVKMTLAPVVVRRRQGESYESALARTTPTSACQFNIGGKNYYTAERPGPPLGLLGKWLQAYKIESYWADHRFGDGSEYDGAEQAKRRIQERIAKTSQEHNEIIKSINDADDRFNGGLGDTPLPNIDIGTPEGRWASMQYQLYQLDILDVQIQEKQRLLQMYEEDKAKLLPPPQAPAEIKRQFETYQSGLDAKAAGIREEMQQIINFSVFARDIVDDRNASATPNFNYHTNRCFIYRRPKTFGNYTEFEREMALDPILGVNYEKPVEDPGMTTTQRHCVRLRDRVLHCSGIAWPEDLEIRITPQKLDD